MTVFIGDIHCEKRGLDPTFFTANTIQVGDLCLFPYHKQARYDAPRYFIEGNHDCYPQLRENNSSPYEVTKYGVKTNLFHIPRGFVDNGVLFIGGGFSIDNRFRIDGRDWFSAREELTYAQMDRIANIDQKIDVVIAHDCPSAIYKNFLNIDEQGGHSKSLQLIFEKFLPSLWIYGHHHTHRIDKHYCCKFICLDICQKVDIPEIKLSFIDEVETKGLMTLDGGLGD